MISFIELPEDIHLYICKSLYPRHINHLVRACTILHRRLNSELWKAIFASNSAKQELFLESSRLGHLDTIRRLVDELNFDFSNITGHESLRVAAKNGHSSIVAYLLTEGVEYFNEANYRNLQKAIYPGLDEPSALQIAAELGDADTVRLLLGHSATLEDKVGALKIAVQNGHEVVVSSFLQEGDPALPELLSLASDTPLLQLAINAMAEPVVSTLLEHGLDVDMHDSMKYMTPLRQAVETAWPWAVKTLLARGADVSVVDIHGNTALHAAMRRRGTQESLEIVRLLLRAGGDLRCRNNVGRTPIDVASMDQHLDLIRFLIESGSADLSNSKYLDRLICAAVVKGDKALVAESLRLGANVNQPKSGPFHSSAWPPLHHAAYGGHMEIMELLLSKGAIVDPFPEADRLTPLHLALGQGHLAAAQWLLDRGSDIHRISNRQHPWPATDTTFKSHWTCLHFAALGGMEVFRLVLDTGYFPLLDDPKAVSLWESAICGRGGSNPEFLQLVLETIRDDNGEYRDPIDPVTHIFKLGHELNKGIVMAMLSDSNFDLNKADETGQTLLHKAMIYENEGVGQLLLELGVDVNVTDSNGRTALYYAAENQDSQKVRMLLDAGATPHTDNLENSPLSACLFGKSSFISQSWAPTDELLTAMRDIIQELVEHGVDPNQFYRQRPILHELLFNQTLANSMLAVQILLDLGADPNIIDESEMTPLHRAASSGDIRTISRLLLGGADLTAKTKGGMTAVQLAEEHGWNVAVDLLLRGAAGLDISASEVDALYDRISSRVPGSP
ncbi:ankyrin repeat-containing domain protein [Aspergillus granulosus]|uniref:Ankyrin repeat-containing domain protein n=1 Tax=Aspergillus granulosus TaxID=176169 RepID=A0ABR4HWG0_9EURO